MSFRRRSKEEGPTVDPYASMASLIVPCGAATSTNGSDASGGGGSQAGCSSASDTEDAPRSAWGDGVGAGPKDDNGGGTPRHFDVFVSTALPSGHSAALPPESPAPVVGQPAWPPPASGTGGGGTPRGAFAAPLEGAPAISPRHWASGDVHEPLGPRRPPRPAMPPALQTLSRLPIFAPSRAASPRTPGTARGGSGGGEAPCRTPPASAPSSAFAASFRVLSWANTPEPFSGRQHQQQQLQQPPPAPAPASAFAPRCLPPGPPAAGDRHAPSGRGAYSGADSGVCARPMSRPPPLAEEWDTSIDALLQHISGGGGGGGGATGGAGHSTVHSPLGKAVGGSHGGDSASAALRVAHGLSPGVRLVHGSSRSGSGALSDAKPSMPLVTSGTLTPGGVWVPPRATSTPRAAARGERSGTPLAPSLPPRGSTPGVRPPSAAGSRPTSAASTGRPATAPGLGRCSWGPPPVSPRASSGKGRAGSASPSPGPPRMLHPAVLWDAQQQLQANSGAQPVAEVPTDEKGRPYPYILPPVFPGAPPTFCFVGTAEEKQRQGLQPFMRHKCLVRYAGIANSPVKAAFKEAGMHPTRSKNARWVVCWGGLLDAAQLGSLHEFQRVNHFPGTWELGRKDYLYRNVYNMRRTRGDAFDIVPRFFLLPRDYDEFRADYERFPERMYIQKPSNSSRGRGIRMVTKPSDITKDCKDVLVQQYIHDPLLIDGYKFDMRIYAIATCLDPLRLYVYEDGLARFATEQYSQDRGDLSKRCVHLTNYSINKKSSKFVPNTAVADAAALAAAEAASGGDSEAVGSKWSLAALRRRIEADGLVAWPVIWQQVHEIIAKSLIAAEPRMNTDFKMKVPHRCNCFEVWGFDIMLDEAFRAWLIEANTCPSLAADSPMDKRVKNAMVADALHLVGVVPYDPDAYEAAEEGRRQARLTGLGARTDQRTKVRTLKEAEELDFNGMAPEQLPDIVIESEAEQSRRGGWERVFPCVEDPMRFCDLFDTPRSSNTIMCKFYAHKAASARSSASRSGRRATSTPLPVPASEAGRTPGPRAETPLTSRPSGPSQ